MPRQTVLIGQSVSVQVARSEDGEDLKVILCIDSLTGDTTSIPLTQASADAVAQKLAASGIVVAPAAAINGLKAIKV